MASADWPSVSAMVPFFNNAVSSLSPLPDTKRLQMISTLPEIKVSPRLAC